MEIQFVTSVATVTSDTAASRRLFVDGLGLPLTADEGDDYLHSEQVPGVHHLGLWPLHQAAQACFGSDEWPADVPVPQACIEFELADLEALDAAVSELEASGHQILHPAQLQPWGQTVARVLSPEHLIVGLSYAPWMHE